MLNFFTDPYEDEILYSSLARYHYYSGNVSMRETLIQVFGDGNALPSIYVPCRLEYLANQLENEVYTSEYLISMHTILPYYLSFMDQKKQRQVLNAVRGNGGQRLFTLIGMAAGGICRKTGLYYCPQCAIKDIKRYGEAYFHRIHQIEGILVCDSHGCRLKEYPLAKEKLSRIEYVKFDIKNVGLEQLDYDQEIHNGNIDDKNLESKLHEVAKAARYIINHDLSKFDNGKVHENITYWLANKGYLTINGRVRQNDFCHELFNFHGERLLDVLECSFDLHLDYSWPREAVRRPDKAIHPVRYILLALFLCGSVEGLFYPSQRKKVKSLEMTNSQEIGTKERCKIYDEEWDKLLIKALEIGGSLRDIARRMDCDPKTVVKHTHMLGITNILNSNMKVYIPKDKQQEVDYSVDADDIRRYVKENPECTRTQVHKLLCRQYMRLYKHQRELLYSVLPDRGKQIPTVKEKVNWSIRDVEILEKAKKAYSRLRFTQEPIRISFSRIIKEIRYSSLRFYIDKLPMTKKFIQSITESVEDFQLRRVDYTCYQLYEQKGTFEKWEVMRIAGLKKTVSGKVLAQIERNIEELCNGKLGEENEKDNYQRLAISR